MEIEAKYRVRGEIAPDALERLDLGPYRLEGRATHQIEDTLLDTADRAITRAGCALRLRRDGPRRLLTFKGPERVEGAVFRREEIETELASDSLDPRSWPAPLRERARGFAGSAGLQPLGRVHNTRATWRILRAGRVVAELALDRGVIAAAEGEDRFHEIEVELEPGGHVGDLEEISSRLAAALPLEPEPRSKLARALALLAAAESARPT